MSRLVSMSPATASGQMASVAAAALQPTPLT
jgi:hypothetical protein